MSRFPGSSYDQWKTRAPEDEYPMDGEFDEGEDDPEPEPTYTDEPMPEPPPIVTAYIFPPIPDRSHDWVAHRDGHEEDGPSGYGKTEADAIADLISLERDGF